MFRHVAIISSVAFALVALGCKETSTPASPSVIGTVSSTWTGTLPNRTTGSHPVCQAALPATAVCLNDLTGTPQAICEDRRYSCSADAGVCLSHGGVYCWRN
jgi:hypothetical protein